MKRTLLIVVAAVISLAATWFVSSSFFFEESLHATREGKAHWYAVANGGFETMTGIPMADLPCQDCHATTLADGTPVDAATYEPGCADCHIVPGDAPAQSVCLGCHGRQGAEIGLSANPDIGHLFTDVHRTAGMECTSCHTSNEMHGTGTKFASMFSEGATEVVCETCHLPAGLELNTSHNVHLEDVECGACHAKTVVSCYNCHFESEVDAHKKRFYGPPPISDFVMLVNSEKTGKVRTASYQSVTYGDASFWAIGPFSAHTISTEARACNECHDNNNIRTYNATGELKIATWDAGEGKITNTKGVIPVPPDWKTTLKLDLVRFLGQPSDDITKPVNPAEWEFMETGPDMGQMLFATPLTQDQMNKLSADVTDVDDAPDVPSRFVLEQNYPNPFNPTTTFNFTLNEPATLSLIIYNLLGEKVATVFVNRSFASGSYDVPWQATGLGSGAYIYRMEGTNVSLSRRLTIVK